MLQRIYRDAYGVQGFAGDSNDIGVNGANLPIGNYQNKPLAHSSYTTNVDTDETYIYNANTQIWRKQA